MICLLFSFSIKREKQRSIEQQKCIDAVKTRALLIDKGSVPFFFNSKLNMKGKWRENRK
jgi:hypothetical protein